MSFLWNHCRIAGICTLIPLDTHQWLLSQPGWVHKSCSFLWDNPGGTKAELALGEDRAVCNPCFPCAGRWEAHPWLRACGSHFGAEHFSLHMWKQFLSICLDVLPLSGYPYPIWVSLSNLGILILPQLCTSGALNLKEIPPWHFSSCSHQPGPLAACFPVGACWDFGW